MPLAGRKAFLFPDLGAYHAWAEKAAKLSEICHFTVSDILERIATEQDIKDGLDIADYLIRYPLQQFQIESSKTATIVTFKSGVKQWQVKLNEHDYPASWDKNYDDYGAEEAKIGFS